MEINTNPHDTSDLQVVDPEVAEEFQEFRRRERERRAKEQSKTTDSAPPQRPTGNT